MRYLVTGGAGFIGSKIIRNLLQSGHQVVALDNLATGNSKNISNFLSDSNFEFVNNSILEPSIIDPLVKSVDRVFHLAAAVGVFNIVQNPLASFTTNVEGTHNMLDACVNHTKPILFTSSSEIYGKNSERALKENDDRIIGSPQISRWSYSEAKAIDEFLMTEYSRIYGLETRIVRLFNTVGPGQLGSYGMVLPRFIQRALRNESVQIYGDGKQTRCFTHVDDVVEAMLLIDSAKLAIGEVFNIGNNSEISMIDLANKIIEMCESKSQIEFVEYREVYQENFEDMRRRVPDTSKITLTLGWEASRSLEQIINDIISFEKKEML
jgi:UDP-glucose 4-epimerase